MKGICVVLLFLGGNAEIDLPDRRTRRTNRTSSPRSLIKFPDLGYSGQKERALIVIHPAFDINGQIGLSDF